MTTRTNPAQVQIDAGDGAQVAALVAHALTVAPSYMHRMNALLTRMLEMFDAKLVAAGIVECVGYGNGHAPIMFHDPVQAGTLSQSETMAMHRYFADLARHPDPAHVVATQRMLTSSGPLVARNQDLVAEDDGSWVQHLRDVRHPGGVGPEMFMAWSITSAALDPSAPHRRLFASFSLHRPFDAPAFDTRDVGMAHALLHGVIRIFEDRLSERESEQLLANLPKRLRQTLSHLLDGASEKAIAQALGLSRHTVHEHIKRLHRMLHVSSRGELLTCCQRLGVTADTLREQLVVKPVLTGVSAVKEVERATKQQTRSTRKPKPG